MAFPDDAGGPQAEGALAQRVAELTEQLAKLQAQPPAGASAADLAQMKDLLARQLAASQGQLDQARRGDPSGPASRALEDAARRLARLDDTLARLKTNPDVGKAVGAFGGVDPARFAESIERQRQSILARHPSLGPATAREAPEEGQPGFVGPPRPFVGDANRRAATLAAVESRRAGEAAAAAAAASAGPLPSPASLFAPLGGTPGAAPAFAHSPYPQAIPLSPEEQKAAREQQEAARKLKEAADAFFRAQQDRGRGVAVPPGGPNQGPARPGFGPGGAFGAAMGALGQAAAFGVMAGPIHHLTAAADPFLTAPTLQGSIKAVEIQLGQALLPAIMEMSKALQDAAKKIKEVRAAAPNLTDNLGRGAVRGTAAALLLGGGAIAARLAAAHPVGAGVVGTAAASPFLQTTTHAEEAERALAEALGVPVSEVRKRRGAGALDPGRKLPPLPGLNPALAAELAGQQASMGPLARRYADELAKVPKVLAPERAEKARREAAARAVGPDVDVLFGNLGGKVSKAEIQAALEKEAARRLGGAGGKGDDFLTNFRGPPAAIYHDPMAVADRLQIAALNQGDLDAKNLQEQLIQLQKSGELLTAIHSTLGTIATNTARPFRP